MRKPQMLKHIAQHLEFWPQVDDFGEKLTDFPPIPSPWSWMVSNPGGVNVVSLGSYEGHQPEYIAEGEWALACRDAWSEGEERIDRIAQSDASGDHYAEDSDAESALSQALSMPSNYHVRLKGVWCDVYDVLQAFGVTNPADQHAVKKMLMPGKRGVKSGIQDRREAIQSLHRAIELEDEQ